MGSRVTCYSECRDASSPPYPGGRVEDDDVGGRSPENSSVVSCMPMYPGPPPGCVPGGCGYEFEVHYLQPPPRRNPTGSKSPGSGSF